jgi:hypothetical protein
LASELGDAATPVAGVAGAARVVPVVPVVAGATGAAEGGIPGAAGASEAPAAPAQTGFDDAMAPANPAMTIEARTFTKDLHPMTVDI